MNTHYITCAETAKMIRVELKRTFPGIKFSVRSSTYSGGASIDVSWTDGPTESLVERVTSKYQSREFDGSIDMAVTVRHWLAPDGSIHLASSNGTTDSRGSIKPIREWMPTPECKLVCFGSNYVHTRRHHSERLLRRAIARLSERYAQFRDVVLTGRDEWKWIAADYRPCPGHMDMGDALRRELSGLVSIRAA